MGAFIFPYWTLPQSMKTKGAGILLQPGRGEELLISESANERSLVKFAIRDTDPAKYDPQQLQPWRSSLKNIGAFLTTVLQRLSEFDVDMRTLRVGRWWSVEEFPHFRCFGTHREIVFVFPRARRKERLERKK